MNRSDLQQLAQRYFIADAGLSVAGIVRRIQLAEGHADCYSTGKTRCDERMCRWRADCMPDPDPAGTSVSGTTSTE